MKIALILNTRYSDNEFEVEYDPPHTVGLIKSGILSTGHEYEFIEADENFLENLKKINPDLVFNRSEGLRGESRESHVPAMLEMLQIPYAGSNVLTTAVSLNKTWTKKFLTYNGILTPKFYTVNNVKELKNMDYSFPVILKPNEEGSSMGINEDNVVFDVISLKKKVAKMIEMYQQTILMEEFIQGREFTVGLIGNGLQEPEILPILEVDFTRLPPSSANVFGQRAKTKYDSLDHYVCPAQIPQSIRGNLQKIALDVWRYLEIKDFARIDFRMNQNNEIFFLEINPLPGMDFDLEENDFSFYPLMAMKAGYTYDELIKKILKSAAQRYGLNF